MVDVEYIQLFFTTDVTAFSLVRKILKIDLKINFLNT